ncbi:carbamoyltransferase N-terminal domain-containing protein [Vibrio mangrovi]|uniref:Carbamoyltransferase N-terminal domain-containing protein n=1 Tax=Vibrio mangrovi TaxID=474394 RepID=A0A1Y6IU48_9VIBR|nr:carbamoyltransferase N-terminal domain-containing protein [Vibrio mangrovi]MDW6003635.1 carbamoyltransferase N-terminal domain-containing protein [Vibrio mangrovi]SMR99573.1 Decarbamoylnovobiocin carbamoyltransferase [Vibrio mangrovi]
MIILGLSNNDYAGACIIKDGLVTAAAHEERFTRVKAHNVFPYHAMNYVLAENEIGLDNVDYIAYGWNAGFDPERYSELYFDRIAEVTQDESEYLPYLHKRLTDEVNHDRPKRAEFESFIRENHLDGKVLYIEHHESHAHAAYLCSPFSRAIAISCDGRGDFQSLTVTQCEGDHFEVLQRESMFDSLGYFYGRITQLLGFKPNCHEDKVTGLASYGDPERLLSLMETLINIDEEGRIRAHFGEGYLPSYHHNYEILERAISGEKPEDVAAAAQRHLENILMKLIRQYVDREHPNNLCLAGGVFGNVKLNQKLRSIDGVENVYILPCMGDDGLPLGAAVCAVHRLNGTRVSMPTMKLGPAVAESDGIIRYLDDKAEFSYLHLSEDQTIIAILLAALHSDLISGIVKGRMEFGARALGNRSVICRAQDSSVNIWLNQRMKRTEFMPFAPMTADIFATDCYVGWQPDQIAAQFITMTYDCTTYFKHRCPAVTDIDGTARPQIITKDSDPFMHQLLVAWEGVSGEPGLINTSLNTGEEPIVNEFCQALSYLEEQVIDLLVFNHDLVVWRSDDQHVAAALQNNSYSNQ